MCEPWKYYATWNKADIGHRWYDYIYVINSTSIETGSRLEVARGWGRREEGIEVTANEDGVSFWGDKNILKLDSGNGYTTLWIH